CFLGIRIFCRIVQGFSRFRIVSLSMTELSQPLPGWWSRVYRLGIMGRGGQQASSPRSPLVARPVTGRPTEQEGTSEPPEDATDGEKDTEPDRPLPEPVEEVGAPQQGDGRAGADPTMVAILTDQSLRPLEPECSPFPIFFPCCARITHGGCLGRMP